ncbi:hypothetical protein GCM10011579_066690 [Streptomyces albiflavescens]|uniref:Uncharacterized protein n=1 Tax=Streptomyces albiflavescens TaxID=1623582 RepID=A0A917YBS6_9ACTN|nr:hypothetical protein [Streptomyces albiflavescens]GGN80781.1 hypothetical protein GCM10011579_066690 [Streptomyces albiflavescens]
MSKSRTVRTTAPETLWLAGGHHTGPAPQEALRANLRKLKADETIHDFLETENSTEADGHVFEARWLVDDAVTVRARLATDGRDLVDAERRWTLAAEAERPWDPAWPSPATMFWPEKSEIAWDHDIVAGLRLQDINPLPQDDKALRRLLKDAGRNSWSINVVVHEAMTPDQRGRLPLARLLPPGLRHRVVEHRAAPEQLQAVNWALYDLGVRVPRGGAVILPGTPARQGYEKQDFTVRSVFLDGSEPTELLDKVVQYAALPWPLPEAAEEAFTALRQNWHLVTLEEELAHARALVSAYAEALDAMTKSRDRYREAADLAHAALAEIKEFRGAVSPAGEESRQHDGNSLHQLTRTIQRVADSLRPRSK